MSRLLKNEILISNRSEFKVSSTAINRAISHLLENEGQSNREVSVLLCSDAEIKALNCKFRNVDETTDVLSFNIEDNRMLGDIVISMDTASMQAAKRGIELEAETVFLALHGCLHLLGYNDDSEEGYHEMIDKAGSAAKTLGYDLKEDWGSLH